MQPGNSHHTHTPRSEISPGRQDGEQHRSKLTLAFVVLGVDELLSSIHKPTLPLSQSWLEGHTV